jgi:ankyrin repeat protein
MSGESTHVIQPISADPEPLKLDDLFAEFYRRGRTPPAQLISRMLDYFSPYIGHEVLNSSGELISLNWADITAYFKDLKGEKDLQDRIKKHSPILATRVTPTSTRLEMGERLYEYSSAEKAQKDLNLLKFLLLSRFPELKHAQVSAEKSFRLTEAQHQAFQSIRYSPRLMKSLRWDSYCFLSPFIKSISHSAGKNAEPRDELRIGNRKQFRVFGDGVYEGKAKPTREKLPHEHLLSRPQSTTLITPHNQVSLFKHTLDSVGVGFAFLPESSGMRRFIKLDRGTVYRPYDHATREEADKFISEKKQDYFPDLDSFTRALHGTTRYNEVMGGLYYELDSTCIIITQDNLSSRAAAQFLAAKTREALIIREDRRTGGEEGAAEFKGEPESIQDYEAPLIYYLPNHPKNYCNYSHEDQEADQREVQKIIADKTYNEYFNKGDFSFLLIAPNPKEVLALTWNGKPVMVEILEKGLFHIAEGLLNRAHAAEKGNLEIMRALIASGANVNQARRDGDTFLIWAIKNRHLEIVRDLIAAGANVNEARRDGDTLLIWAIKNGHLEIARALIAARAHVINQADEYGVTPLIWAIKNGHLEIARALITARAHINQAAQYGGGSTPLIWAAEKGHLEIVRALIAARAHVNKESKYGDTPLRSAAENGHLEIVRALIAAGADVNQAKLYGSPLSWAANNGHLEIVRALIAAGAHVNKANEYGFTPLLWAAAKGHLEIVRALIAAGADVNVNQANEYGSTPLIWAAEKGHLEIVRALIAAGADANKANQYGHTPIFWATQNHHSEVIRELIKHQLNQYISSLSKDPQYYRSFWGRYFGYNAGEKMAAARALLARLTTDTQPPEPLFRHKGALTSGRLGEIYRLCRTHFHQDRVKIENHSSAGPADLTPPGTSGP